MDFVKEDGFSSNKAATTIEPLFLTDLEEEEEDESRISGHFVSPGELTQIDFRSLIGHTDEVHIVESLFVLLTFCRETSTGLFFIEQIFVIDRAKTLILSFKILNLSKTTSN